MRTYLIGGIILLCTMFTALPAHAALVDRVNAAFRQVYGRTPSTAEWQYWVDRIRRGEKKSEDALIGAMAYQNVHPGLRAPRVLGTTARAFTLPPAKDFKTDPSLYPSSRNPNFLADGTLVTSPKSPDVFLIRDGKKSWVLPSILDRWLSEAHFFDTTVILTLSAGDLARYPRTTSVNPLSIGKVLQHPDGTQFYIDDKLRKRKLSAAVRKALRFPPKNRYETTAAHLREFRTGPPLTRTDIQPGGMIIYDGSFHGGRIWRLEEAADGAMTKRLYLGDTFYEAEYYPDESQRVSVSAGELARYRRGPNIDMYPNGWVVGIGSNVYLVKEGTLRLIGSQDLFRAMGYNPKTILRAFPHFLERHAKGQPVGAFKHLVAERATSKQKPTPAPSSGQNLQKVRAPVRTLIARINALALPAYDRELTPAENRFWVDYVYGGEVDTEADLRNAMEEAKASGKLPVRTPRSIPIDRELLKSKWFPYLFYFVHQAEPTDADRTYWFSRIRDGDRDTIEKLGGTLQWLKETSGGTRK